MIALLALVSWFAFKPATPAADFTFQDKAEHFLAFATLALVASIGWAQRRTQQLAVASGLLGYGVFIELVQTQLPTRNGSVADLAADAAGVAAGLWLSLQLRAWADRPVRQKTSDPV
jgi:VanZ family protein